MTTDQEQQFKKFACIFRSLIILAGRRQKSSASLDNYCQQFSHLFQNPTDQYGAIFLSQIVEVTHALGLASYFESYRCYKTIQDYYNNDFCVLIVSEINLNDGQTDLINHCSVLKQIDATGFSLIVPSQDGNDYDRSFIAADWDAKMCHGLVLK